MINRAKSTRNALGRMKYNFMLRFKQEVYSAKVFCVGYNKTGTTTLGKSLGMLGYRNSSFNCRVWRELYNNNKIVDVLRYTAKFDSLDDLPWLKEDMIPILDRVFQGSKFIYLERDEVSWQRSFYEWTHKMTGSYPDKEKGLADFRNHRDFVMNYFEGRLGTDFIILDIRDPKGFRKLAEFLGKPSIQDKFPHYNKT